MLAKFSAFESRLETLDGKVTTFTADNSDHSQSESSTISDPMPPADRLPEMVPSNPWRSARYAPMSQGMLTIERVGTRPIGDFERYPPSA